MPTSSVTSFIIKVQLKNGGHSTISYKIRGSNLSSSVGMVPDRTRKIWIGQGYNKRCLSYNWTWIICDIMFTLCLKMIIDRHCGTTWQLFNGQFLCSHYVFAPQA